MAPAPPPRRANKVMTQPRASTPMVPIRVERGAAPPATPGIRNATKAELKTGPIARLWAIASQVERLGWWPSRCIWAPSDVEGVDEFVESTRTYPFNNKIDETNNSIQFVVCLECATQIGEPAAHSLTIASVISNSVRGSVTPSLSTCLRRTIPLLEIGMQEYLLPILITEGFYSPTGRQILQYFLRCLLLPRGNVLNPSTYPQVNHNNLFLYPWDRAGYFPGECTVEHSVLQQEIGEFWICVEVWALISMDRKRDDDSALYC